MDDPRIYKFGPFQLDPARHILSFKNQVIPVADKPFQMLVTLVEREGKVVTKNELIELIWKDSFVEEANISQNVFRLRKLLEKAQDGRQYIETVSKHGYRFACKVRAEVDRSTHSRVKHRRRGRIASTGHKQLLDPRNDICSLAILPLANASAEASLDQMGDEITESMINTLSQLPYLRVVARSLVFTYKRQQQSVKALAHELGVEAVLTGKIFMLDNVLGVQIELINVADESQFWGNRYTLGPGDISRVHREISQEVSSQLKLRSKRKAPKHTARRYAADVEAYQFYLKGCYHRSKLTAQGLEKGIEYFEKALEREPNSALSYAGLAECYALGGMPFDPEAAQAYAEVVEDCPPPPEQPRVKMSKAKSAALMALELDDTLAETHAALGFIRYVLDWDWAAAEIQYRRAIELQPDYAKAHHWLGVCLRTMGRLDEALEEAKLARELDPFRLITTVELGRIFYFSRYYDQAIKHYREALELEPNFLPAHFRLGEAYIQKGLYDEAMAEFQSVQLISDNPSADAAKAHILGLSGRTDEARDMLKNLKELLHRRCVPSYDLAIVYLALDDKDKALEWLHNAYVDRCVRMIGIKVEPMLDSLRPDPRFTELMRRVGFEP